MDVFMKYCFKKLLVMLIIHAVFVFNLEALAIYFPNSDFCYFLDFFMRNLLFGAGLND